MNPCVILKDFGYLLATSSSTFSYFFDKNSKGSTAKAPNRYAAIVHLITPLPFIKATAPAKNIHRYCITYFPSFVSMKPIFSIGF